jgi:DNA invertase Pin-like site-specific DNA recombinase
MARRAFSYARFSTSEQEDGRSLRRQEEAAKSYCARHGLRLDERTFTDLGVSAYGGANATHGELGVFLEMLNDERIPAGSVLVVENLDRLTRMPDPQQASTLITSIVNAGVDVVTTSPETAYTRANIYKMETWIPLQVQLAVAAEHSRKLSERVHDAWADKRATAGTRKLTKHGPAWLTLTDDRAGWVVIEAKASRVRRAFDLAVEGLGVSRIAGVLNAEYPAGLSGREWQPSYISNLLRSRSVLGEYQPHVGTCAKKGKKKTRRPEGDPIKGYFPAIVEEALFYRVQAALDGRKKGGGRTTGTPNLFNGLLYDAADGRRMVMNSSNGKKVLVSSGAVKRVPGVPFKNLPYDLFERAVLSRLRELTPKDVLDRPGAAEDAVSVLSGHLALVKQKIAQATRRAAEAEDPDVFLDLLEALGAQKKDLTARLEEATAEAACREGDNLGEFVSLIDLLAEAPAEERDGLRARTRVALRRVVMGIWIVVAHHASSRLTYIQVFFRGGRSREYLLYDRRGRKCHPARWSVASWAGGWGTSDVGHSLKDQDTARMVQMFLSPPKPALTAQAAESAEVDQENLPDITDLIRVMEGAATPEGGKPDPAVIGPIIAEVLFPALVTGRKFRNLGTPPVE